MSSRQEAGLVCPACGRRMLSPDERCSGRFTDTDHPSNVAPIAAPKESA